MTRVCCPSCRLRFAGATAMSLSTCPECGDALEETTSAHALVGFRLFEIDDSIPWAIAAQAALLAPEPGLDR